MRRTIPLIIAVLALALTPSTGAAARGAAVERPFAATLTGATTSLQYAPGFPVTWSTFDGRCSVPSGWVISFAGQGRSPYLGAFTWTSSHCTQAGATPQDPVTISDGHLTYVAANGDVLYEEYGNGFVSVMDPPTVCIDTDVTFSGGTGRFVEASGRAVERGCFSLAEPNLPALEHLFITSAGTITFNASDRTS